MNPITGSYKVNSDSNYLCVLEFLPADIHVIFKGKS